MPIVKNEPVANKRIMAPIAVYNANGNPYPGLTFGHAVAVTGAVAATYGVSWEVEVWNGGSWVAGSADAVEDAPNGTYRYPASQAEVNINSFAMVRLTKTGFDQPFTFYAPIIGVDTDTIEAEAALGLAEVIAELDTIEASIAGVLERITAVAVAGSPSSTIASRVLTTGAETGTIANTKAEDGTYWDIDDAAGVISLTVDFDDSATAGSIGTDVEFFGYLVGAANVVHVDAYNWGAAAFERIKDIQGTASALVESDKWALSNAHTQAGVRRLKFSGAGLVAAKLRFDRLLGGYAIAPPTVAAIQAGLATAAALATAQTAITDIQTDVDELQTSGAAIAAQLLRVLGLLHENALADKYIYDATTRIPTSFRLRGFASAAAKAAATIDGPDTADGEIERWNYTATIAAGKLASFGSAKAL